MGRVRGFHKHYELLDKAKQLVVDARDELVRIKTPLLQKIQTIASDIVGKAIDQLNMDIHEIEQHQAVSKDSEKNAWTPCKSPNSARYVLHYIAVFPN